MAKLEVDLGDQFSVKTEKPKIVKVPVEQPTFKQKSPNAWAIKPGANTEIVATSDLGEEFQGTIAEFNKRLRA